jgi:hypothetical protein
MWEYVVHATAIVTGIAAILNSLERLGFNVRIAGRATGLVEGQARRRPSAWIALALGCISICLSLIIWIPYFQRPGCQNYIIGYGPLSATIDTTSLVQDAGNARLMMVGVIRDSAIDPMVDVAIARSRTYEIVKPTLLIELAATPAFSAKYRLGATVNLYLLEVPKEFAIERLTTLASVGQLHGKILDSKSVVIAIP